jgi:hypothetical protein
MSLKDTFKISNKHVRIDKANQQTIIAISATVAIVMFTLAASQALIKQMRYQQLVISKRGAANTQLEKNIKATGPLVAAYEAFDGTPESIIGTQDKNSKIVLDALPSKYDFPALATSLEGLMVSSGVKIEGLTGTDNEAAAEQNSDDPKPIEIPVSMTGTGNTASVQKLIDNLQKSIRPIKIVSIGFKGSDTALQAQITAVTYYQPQRNYAVKDEVVKPTQAKTQKKPSSTTATTSTQEQQQ